jgi:small subunit ribosomal protein S8e
LLPQRSVLYRYENHYAVAIGKKKGRAVSEADDAILNKHRSKHAQKKIDQRKGAAKVDQHIDEQMSAGRILACISSRPGQCGRADGYILEGKELEFYQRKLRSHRR